MNFNASSHATINFFTIFSISRDTRGFFAAVGCILRATLLIFFGFFRFFRVCRDLGIWKAFFQFGSQADHFMGP